MRPLTGALSMLVLGCGGMSSGATRAGAPPAADVLLGRAIVWAGGVNPLARARALRWDGDATVHAGTRLVAIRGEWAIQPPDSAVVATYDTTRGPGTMRRLIVAGPNGWTEQNGTFTPMPAEMLASERDEFYLYDIMRLVPLLEPDVVLRPVAADSLRNAGFEITRPGRPAVTAWIAASGQLAHLQLQIVDARDGARATQDLWLSGSIEADGIRWPRQIRITMNGAPYFDLTIARLTTSGQIVEPLLAGPH